jgi:hypothetical protein
LCNLPFLKISIWREMNGLTNTDNDFHGKFPFLFPYDPLWTI